MVSIRVFTLVGFSEAFGGLNGYSSINCDGSESRLKECIIEEVNFNHYCSFVGITQCYGEDFLNGSILIYHNMSVSQSYLLSFYAIPIFPFKFPKFFIYLYKYARMMCGYDMKSTLLITISTSGAHY